MATHNQVRLIGFVLKEPQIMGDKFDERVKFIIRTIRRDFDCYYDKIFEDITIYFDDTDSELMDQIKELKLYDFIDIKGVINIWTVRKKSTCPECGKTNIKMNGIWNVVYPLHLININPLHPDYDHTKEMAESILVDHYREVSNQVLICGTVVNDPELKDYKKMNFCQYQLGINRKYYIKSQDALTADYPWVYTYGEQALDDSKHLIPGSTVLLDCFIRTRGVNAKMECAHCGNTYYYINGISDLIPYSVEYLKDYLTDEDIAEMESEQKEEDYKAALKKIFG